MHIINKLHSNLCLAISDLARKHFQGINVHTQICIDTLKFYKKNYSSPAHCRLYNELNKAESSRNEFGNFRNSTTNTCLSIQLASHDNPNQARNALGSSEEAETKTAN